MKIRFEQFNKQKSCWEEVTGNRFQIRVIWGLTQDGFVFLRISHHSFHRYYHTVSVVNFVSRDWTNLNEVIVDIDSEDEQNDYQLSITAENEDEINLIENMQGCFQMKDRSKETDYILFYPTDRFTSEDIQEVQNY